MLEFGRIYRLKFPGIAARVIKGPPGTGAGGLSAPCWKPDPAQPVVRQRTRWAVLSRLPAADRPLLERTALAVGNARLIARVKAFTPVDCAQ